MGGRGKTTPYIKLFRVMLETWNLLRKYTHMKTTIVAGAP